MRNASGIAAAVIVALLVPAHASAWGFEAHKFIMRRAIDLLPPELEPFYEQHRDELAIRVTDPDLWRTIGWDEDANHFLDFGAKEYGDYPFTALPRDLDAAIEKFGEATVKRNGMVPWRASEMFGQLRRAFERIARGQNAAGDVVLFSGIVAHYMQDSNQPLHATINYDGQLSGNDGIHSRFEAALFERFQSRLTMQPARATPMRNPRDAAFAFLLSGYQLADSILKADTEAVAGKEFYDDDYFDRLFSKVRPILERRLSESITATASAIVGAWDAAGRPSLAPQTGARPPQRVKKPQR
jgi:hypothetical protein